MTVRELIKLLETKPQDARVITTWEGTEQTVEEPSVYMSHDGVLVIDADGCQDKDAIMTGINRFGAR